MRYVNRPPRGPATCKFALGRSAFPAAREGGDSIGDSGKYVEIWRKQSDGSWKIFRDTWTSDYGNKARSGCLSGLTAAPPVGGRAALAVIRSVGVRPPRVSRDR